MYKVTDADRELFEIKHNLLLYHGTTPRTWKRALELSIAKWAALHEGMLKNRFVKRISCGKGETCIDRKSVV